MRFFMFTIAGIIATGALFILGATLNFPFLMITMCPGALVALWLNGFAASKSGVRIVVNSDDLGKAVSNQKKSRIKEYS